MISPVSTSVSSARSLIAALMMVMGTGSAALAQDRSTLLSFQEVLCSLAENFPHIDLLPDGEHRMAIRVVTPRPEEALRQWQVMEKSPLPPQISRLVVERPRPMIALILDDLGIHGNQLKVLWDLGQPVTYALLPKAQYTEQYVRQLQARFSSMLVHLPMEPTDPSHMTIEGYMTMTQTPQERRTILEDAISRIPTAVGVNNHMGSRLTADRWIMAELVDSLPPHLAVVDSRTTEHSALREAAAAAGRPNGARAVFVDNVQKEEAVFARLKQGYNVAKAYGHAIVIAHPYKESMAAIRDFLHSYGRFVHLVTVERVLRPPGVSPWLRACPIPGGSGPDPLEKEELARDAP